MKMDTSITTELHIYVKTINDGDKRESMSDDLMMGLTRRIDSVLITREARDMHDFGSDKYLWSG